MKITGVSTTLYRIPLSRPMGDAHCPSGRTHGGGCLVRLHTDADLTGIGLCDGHARAGVEILVRDVLQGRDPRHVTGLWQRMLDSDMYGDGRGRHGAAMAVLDQALWDIKAKAAGEPLWKTLGAPRARFNVYASDAGLPLDEAALSAWFARMADDYGFRAGKLQVGLDMDADLARLARVREALRRGPQEPELMIDADEVWSPKQAIRRIGEMERQFDLTWVEAPAPRWDFPGLKRVSDSVRAAVCAGDYLDGRGEFLPHFLHHSLDVVQINPARLGITAALQLADAAYGYELPVTLPAAPGNINAHLAGAMPYFMSLEVIDPEPVEGLFTTDVRIEDGWAVIGDRPGNSLVLDEAALAAAAVDSLPETGRARRPGAGLYEQTAAGQRGGAA